MCLTAELLASSRQVYFYRLRSRSENTAPSLRTYLVAQNSASWNQLAGWLREIAALREAA